MKVSYLPSIKRGDTFYFFIQWDDALVTELKSQVKNSLGQPVADAVIESTDVLGLFKVSVADTTAWPLGSLYTDIRRTSADGIESSENIGVIVEREVTKWAQ